MKSFSDHIPNSLFHHFLGTILPKKDPWQWDKSTVIKDGADALLLVERIASMARYQGDEPVLRLVPALWLSAHQRPSQSILSSLWGLGPGS